MAGLSSVTRGLTAEDRDQLRNPTLFSSMGLPLPISCVKLTTLLLRPNAPTCLTVIALPSKKTDPSAILCACPVTECVVTWSAVGAAAGAVVVDVTDDAIRVLEQHACARTAVASFCPVSTCICTCRNHVTDHQPTRTACTINIQAIVNKCCRL